VGQRVTRALSVLKKVASIRKGRTLRGRVAMTPCNLTLDSHTVVRAGLITAADYTGKSSRVGHYYGCWNDVPMAEVWLEVEKKYKLKHEVLMVP